MRAPAVEQVLGGKYRLVRPLGKGGLAAVWHAEHLALHSPVVLKIIDPVSADEEEALQRFLREARAAAALRSPHVVQILDYGVDQGIPYIVMELLEGESLAERLDRLRRVSLEETARIIKHVARALSRAHEAGIIHRDLKPANIFLVPNDDEEVVKVLDFGLAKATTIALGSSVVVGATPAGALLGTPHYMSPEQAEGIRTLDHRTDIWSVGVIAYECLLGSAPFGGHSLGAVLSAICSRPPPVPSSIGPVPAGFDAWFARACAPKPGERFASAKQMAEEFTRLCEPSGTPSDTPARAVAFAPLPGAEVAPSSVAQPLFAPSERHGSSPSQGGTLRSLGDGVSAGASGVQRQRGSLILAGLSALAAVALAWGIWRALQPVANDAGQASHNAALLARPPTEPPAEPEAPAAPAAPPQIERRAEAPSPAPKSVPQRASTPAKVHPKKTSAPAAPCEPPWYLDKAGARRMKRDCL